MQIIFLLISLCVLFCADLCALAILKKKSKPTKPLFIDFVALGQSRSFRNLALAKLYKHYMSCDSLLGFRIKAYRQAFKFADTLKGKKYNDLKQLKLKNLFEISTDKYGFIINQKN